MLELLLAIALKCALQAIKKNCSLKTIIKSHKLFN